MAIKRFKIEKLIRDHLPEIMRAKGIIVEEKTLGQDELIAALKMKLIEETSEVKEATSEEDLIEELSDTLEVFHSLLQATQLNMELIEKRRQAKRAAKGGFEGKKYVSYVEIEEGNRAIDYYLARPNHYPQIERELDRAIEISQLSQASQSHQLDQSNCIFCQRGCPERNANIYARFKHCYAIEDNFPVSKGHLLIIPYRHIENWFAANTEVQIDMMQALNFLKEQLDLKYQPDGYNIGANCGQTAGQSVMHLHLHLIPRYTGDMADPKGGVRGVIPAKQKY